MAWTTPRTWVAGEVVTAAIGNVHWRDQLNALRGTPANRCSAYHNVAQTGIVGATTLNLNSEDHDSASMHDLVTNNNRVTIPSGGDGWYVAHASSYVGTSTGAGNLRIRKNGTLVPGGATRQPAREVVVRASVYAEMAAGDYFDLEGECETNAGDFGGNVANKYTRLTVFGPLPPT